MVERTTFCDCGGGAMPDNTGLSQKRTGGSSRDDKNQVERIKAIEEQVKVIREELEFFRRVITADRRPNFVDA